MLVLAGIVTCEEETMLGTGIGILEDRSWVVNFNGYVFNYEMECKDDNYKNDNKKRISVVE